MFFLENCDLYENNLEYNFFNPIDNPIDNIAIVEIATIWYSNIRQLLL